MKEDRYWKVEEIRHYIIDELKKRFPESIIEREFDHIDIMVLGPNIPVEIQKTPYQVSQFEDLIRRQIEQNIELSGQCWFFFDAKLLYYLQNCSNSQISMNMDWFYQFFKSKKLKVFTITINGIIRELEDKDFDFIKKLSSTCKLDIDSERRILERNKYSQRNY